MSTARAERAKARVMESCSRVSEAASRLEVALEESNGVPVRSIDPEDSLAVSLDGVRSDASLLQTNRSARSHRRARTAR